MDGFEERTDLLDRLGPHSIGKSCLYLKRLDDVDLAVLEELIRASVDGGSDGLTRSAAAGPDPQASRARTRPSIICCSTSTVSGRRSTSSERAWAASCRVSRSTSGSLPARCSVLIRADDQQLVAGRGRERPGRGPASQLDVGVGERPVGQLDADVADDRDHVGPQTLRPVPLSRCGIGERCTADELEGGLQTARARPVDPASGEDLQALPVRADRGVQHDPTAVGVRAGRAGRRRRRPASSAADSCSSDESPRRPPTPRPSPGRWCPGARGSRRSTPGTAWPLSTAASRPLRRARPDRGAGAWGDWLMSPPWWSAGSSPLLLARRCPCPRFVALPTPRTAGRGR